MYNTYGNINMKEAFEDQGGIDKFVRWRVKLMEQAIQLLDMDNIENMIIVHDYEGVSFMKMDKNMKLASKTLIKLFQDNYPETLAVKIFVNVPWFFDSIYSVVTAFTTDTTKKKFVVCSKDSIRERMLTFIDVESLPQEYGGFSKTQNSPSSATTTTATTALSAGAEKPLEVTIESGGKHKQEREVKAGDVVLWEFTSVAYDIGFSVHFQTSEEKEKEKEKKEKKKEDEVVKYARLEKSYGSYECQQGGLVTLKWDNSYSFMKKKTIIYKIYVLEKSPTPQKE